jgi:phage terminase small subunit
MAKGKKSLDNLELTPEQQEMADALTDLQRRFIVNVVAHKMSRRQAYFAAGGTAKSGDSADATCWQLFHNPKVQAFYKSVMRTAYRESIISKVEALDRLSDHARVKLTDLFTLRQKFIETDDDVQLVTRWEMKPLDQIEPWALACVKSVKETKYGQVVELYDANATLKLIAELQGWNAPAQVDHLSSDGSMSPPKSFKDMYED